jgi:hypothetical protein
MSTYPVSPRTDLLKWCEAHVPAFNADPEAIGLSPGQAADFALLAHEAAAALVAQEKAQQLALVATRQAQAAFAALQAGAGDAVRSIRAFAELAAEPNAVYASAQIAPPADATPTPPPAKPRRLRVTLEAATGALELSWKATSPRRAGGTAYIIRRRLPGETAFGFLGVTGVKTFVDNTVPAGVEQVQYSVQGQRGAKAGPVSEVLTVAMGAERGKSQNFKTSKSQNEVLGIGPGNGRAALGGRVAGATVA